MFYLVEHNVFLNNVLCEALVEATISPILDKYIPWWKKIKVP